MILTTAADSVVLTDGGEVVAATASTLTPQVTTTTYPAPSYNPVTTTTAGDSLVGGSGQDTLALYGGGTYRLDQLAVFTGFEKVALINPSNTAASVTLGSQSLALSVTGVASGGYVNNTFALGGGRIFYHGDANSGYVTFSVSSAANWNGLNDIEGAAPSSPYTYAAPTYVTFLNYSYPYVAQTYDLRSATLANLSIQAQGYGETLLINNAVLAGVKSFYGYTSSGSPTHVLSTSESTLDLSHNTISGFDIVSTNTSGTTFTAADIATAAEVKGGAGYDTLVLNTVTLTDDQRTALFVGSSIEVIKDASGTYDFDPSVLRLTTDADSITLGSGGRTVAATASTLTPQVTTTTYPAPSYNPVTTTTAGDSLVGGSGQDTLALYGGGTYRLDQLAVFTGFEKVALINPSNTAASVTLGSQSLALSVTGVASGGYVNNTFALGGGRIFYHGDANSGYVTFSVSSAANWNGLNDIEGAAPSSPYTYAAPTYVTFLNYSYPYVAQTYDLRSATLANLSIQAQGYGETLLINNAVLAGVKSFYGYTSSGSPTHVLSTSESTLDLSHNTISGFDIVSTNTSGTTFTAADIATAAEVKGGAGYDTLVLNGVTLTDDQRTALFVGSSIEVIKDASGTYDFDPSVLRLTTDADSITLGSGGRTVAATASTLTPQVTTTTYPAPSYNPVTTTTAGDSLVGGSGQDTLALYGGGTYRLDQLAVFTGFEKVALINPSNTAASVTLGSQSLALSVTGVASGGYVNNTFALGGGRIFYHGDANSGYVTFSVSSAANWNGLNDIEGAAPSSPYTYAAPTYVTFLNYSYPYVAQTYDLRSATLANLSIQAQGYGETLLINNAVLAGVKSFYGYTSSGSPTHVLSTSESTLDLSHNTISGFDIVSTNTSGTTFTAADIATAAEVKGGAGYDTLVLNTVTLTDDQRTALFVGSSIEVIKDASGTSYAPIYTSQSNYFLPLGSSVLHYNASGAFNGHGNAGDNVVYAENALQATLHGAAGADQLYGGIGNDSLYGDQGADTLYGGAGDDYFRTLTGEGPDVIFGGDGSDLLTIERTDATQNLTADLSLTTLQALGEGSLFQGIEQIRVAGGIGADSFVGGGLDDVLKGNGGADTLSGGAGNDVLQGGAGHDSLTGGAGVDTFRFDGPVSGSDDTITDFTSGDDHVALSKAGFGIHSLSDFDIVTAASGAFETKATLVVDASAHTISWDADGNGAGVAILLAHGAFTTAPGDYLLF